jgi:hypothetical protein
MDGFKNSTKTQYFKGGAKHEAKGAAKIAKVMGEFKDGKLHSGSKTGPAVTSPKQAVAIAMGEARKPLKRAMGGDVTQDALDSAARMQGEEAHEANVRGVPQRGMKPRRVTVERTTVSEEPQSALSRRLGRVPTAAEMARSKGKPSYRDTPLIGGALGSIRDAVRDATGFKKGGLSAMPRGKKC